MNIIYLLLNLTCIITNIITSTKDNEKMDFKVPNTVFVILGEQDQLFKFHLSINIYLSIHYTNATKSLTILNCFENMS